MAIGIALLGAGPALATPTVNLTSPAGGTAIRGVVTMSADASDASGISRVDFFRQTAPGNFTFVQVGSATSPPYQTLLNTVGLPDGDYNIRATAFANDSSNFASGTVVSFDNTPPTASLSGPLNGAVLSGTVVLAGSQSDPPAGAYAGVATWSFELSPHNAGSWSIIKSGVGGTSETTGWDTTQVANGSYDVRLKVADAAGNVAISNIVTGVQVDNSNPQGVLKVDGSFLTSLDPANAFSSPTEQIFYATCAKLVNYPDEAGQQGLADLQPEVATTMPTVSDDGKTYVFTLGSNWKFSDGSNLTPQSFINAIQRDLSPFGAWRAYLGDIVGAQEFINGTSPTISGLSAAGNQLTIQLNNPDNTLLPKLALSLGCAVPSSAPAFQIDSLPSAGPYYVASYVPNVQLILDVNPYYAGSRTHGFAQIVYKLGQTPAEAEADVLGGQADYSAVGVPSSDFASLEATYGAGASPRRFFTNPSLLVRSLVFNTSRPIFAGANVRRAVATAVDRQGLAAAFPGSSLTDQLLPPGVPGFQDATIYPYNVTDFTAAATVVQAAGFGGATVVVYTCNSQACQNQTNALQLSLSRVGLVADIHYMSSVALDAALRNPDEPFDMATFGWAADYADPFDFLNVLLDPTVATFNPSH
ncbi:MAG TPA: ABC transporter substrate-binding protein, partial [Gaiellaceae bacterium]